MRLGPRIGPRSSLRIGPRMGSTDVAGGAVPQTTLTVAINDSADPVMTSATYAYTVVVTNTGANDATNVVCDVNLDPQCAFVSGSGTGWTVTDLGGNHIQATRMTLVPGAAPTITVNVTSAAAAETSSTTADADSDNSPAATQDVETTVVKLVSKDATSGIRVPANVTEWTDFRTITGIAAANPNSLWLCQEASGNLGDAIGSLTLTASGTVNYNQAVSGWTRTAVATTEAGNGKAVAASGTGPSPATTSQMWLFICSMPATPGTSRVFMGMNTGVAATAYRMAHFTTGVPRTTLVNSNFDGASSISSGVHPCLMRYDRTGSAATGYTDLEKITTTYNSGVVDGDKGLGNAGGSTSSARSVVYGAMWSGSNAELSDANIKALLQALGFTIGWS